MKLILILLIFVVTGMAETVEPPSAPGAVGRWQVKFALINTPEKNFVFTAQEGGDGTFQLLDTGPDNKPVPNPQAASWSLANNNLSISGEVELQTGTCCRETGTLILKSKLTSADSISGKLIFVTNIDEDESPYKYHSTTGTFTATRLK